MKEIEILVEVYDSIDKAKGILNNFAFEGIKTVIDEYYYDPKREELKPDKDNKLFNCLRLRTKNNDYTLTYKDDIYDGEKWLYSNEYETKVESLDTTRNILEKLGLKKFIIINNKKHVYRTDKFEIVLEEVKDLGLFMEVEYCTEEDIDVKKMKNEIDSFIKSLNINVSEELNMGKPEMYLKKFNVEIE